MKVLIGIALSIILLPGLILSQLVFNPPIDRDGISFDDTPVNNVAEIQVTVTSQPRQDAPQDVRVSANDNVFGAEPQQVRMQPNEQRQYVFTFEPDDEQGYNGQYTITAGDVNGRMVIYRIAARGRGVAGEAQVFIERIDEGMMFEVEDEDELPSADLFVSNRGNDIGSFSADYEADWLLVDPLRGNVAPDQEAEITISITEDFPQENGEYQEVVSFHLDNPELDEVELLVTLTVNILDVGDQVIQMREGWNMVSANRDLQDMGQGIPTMRELLADVADDISIIKNGAGRFCVPQLNFWGIDHWNMAEGYKVKTVRETDLIISGQQIPHNRPINLNHGWNLIAYYPEFELTFGDALQGLVDDDQLLIAKNGRGQFYVPQFNVGGNITMITGKGFMLNVVGEATLAYPRQRQRVNAVVETPHVDFQHFPEPINTSQGMSVLFTELTGIQIVGGAEVACVTPDGVIAGATVIEADSIGRQFGMGVWKDDPDTEGSEGFSEEGQPLRFLYWDPVQDWELDITIEIIERIGTMNEAIYQTDGLLVLGSEVSVANSELVVPEEFTVSGLYPNPFNSSSEVEFVLNRSQRVSVTLHSLSGRVLERYANKLYSAGTHRLTLEFYDLPTGVYLLSLQTADVRKVVRAVLIR